MFHTRGTSEAGAAPKLWADPLWSVCLSVAPRFAHIQVFAGRGAFWERGKLLMQRRGAPQFISFTLRGERSGLSRKQQPHPPLRCVSSNVWQVALCLALDCTFSVLPWWKQQHAALLGGSGSWSRTLRTLRRASVFDCTAPCSGTSCSANCTKCSTFHSEGCIWRAKPLVSAASFHQQESPFFDGERGGAVRRPRCFHSPSLHLDEGLGVTIPAQFWREMKS